jgi:ferredoxin, 2Fe-2S
MPILTVLPNQQTIEVATGTSLLSALRGVGALLGTKCETKCTGQCHVFVQEGRKTLSKVARAENEVLDTIVGVGTKSRCACQALMGEQDVSVELLGFASG